MSMMTEDDFKAKEKKLQLRAESGDIEAYKLLGNLYYKGLSGNDKNNAKAFPFWLHAADQGDDYAAGIVGVKMFNGVMGEDKRAEAFPYLKRGAKHFDEYGYVTKPAIALAHAYRTGVGCEVDRSRAMAWYEFAALKNDIEAQYNLGLLGFENIPEENNTLQKPLRWLCCAYINGSKKAEIALNNLMNGQQPACTKKEIDDAVTDIIEHGLCPVAGTFLSKDMYEELLQLYKKQADDGRITSMRFTGDLLLTGYGTKEEGYGKDVAQAITYYKRAAECGDGDSARKLGQRYLESDKAAAFNYISQAAQWKDPRARYEMGLLYRFGIGCAPDPKKAIQYLKPLALLNHGNSQFHLFEAMLDTRVEEHSDDDYHYNMNLFMDALHWLACAYVNGVEEAIKTADDLDVLDLSYWNDRIYLINQYGVDEMKYPGNLDHPVDVGNKSSTYQGSPGNQLNYDTENTQTQNESKELTIRCKIWFWLVLVMNALSAMAGLALALVSPYLGVISLLSGIVIGSGAAVILFYKSIYGFYMIVAAAALSLILNMFAGGDVAISFLGAILLPLISYYFVKKNADVISRVEFW